MQKRTEALLTVLCVISGAAFTTQSASAASILTVDLGSAAGFAVLAGAGITIAAPANSTTVTGSIGSYNTVSITGLENLILNGVNHAGDGVTQTAKTDLMLAYIDAAGRTATSTFVSGYNLNGTLLTGVYQSPGSLSLNGAITLDAQGDPNAVWIFQMASTLDVASAGQVFLTNGARASNVFWQVGSSATLATGAHLQGSILAAQSITLNTGAFLEGRALASGGAVTLGANNIAIPEPSGSLLAVTGVCGLLAFKRRR